MVSTAPPMTASSELRSARPTITVCMATHNGEAHIREQIDSILRQLCDADEIVVIDDASTDRTSEIVASYGDPRIRLERLSRNIGYSAAFERAIGGACGEILMLSDQDDIWVDGRVDVLLDALRHADVVAANCTHFGGPLTPFLRLRLAARASRWRLRNIVGIVIGYRLHWGNAMAFTANFRRAALPFPAGLRESHDQWLALLGNVSRRIVYRDEDVTLHRLHAGNVTPRRVRAAHRVIGARIQFLRQLLVAAHRTRALAREGG